MGKNVRHLVKNKRVGILSRFDMLAGLEAGIMVKLAEHKKKGYRESCMVTVRERTVSILPFFANAVSVLNDGGEEMSWLSLLYAKDIEELLEMAKKDYSWYRDTLGEKETDILESLCGHPSKGISRYLAIGAMQNMAEFYNTMVVIIAQEAVEAARTECLVLEYGEGIQNTMALSYYLCIKWFMDSGFTSKGKLNIDFLDGTIEDILNIPGPIQDYFNGLIDEDELKRAQNKIYIDGNRLCDMSPLDVETIESYVKDTYTIDGVPVESDNLLNSTIAADLRWLKTTESFIQFNRSICGVLVNDNYVDKLVDDIKKLKLELTSEIETNKEIQRSNRHHKKEARKAVGERDLLLRKIDVLNKELSKLPETTADRIDKLNADIADRDDVIRELKATIKDLAKKDSTSKKECSELKKQNKKLLYKVDILEEENFTIKEELDSIKESDKYDCTPLEKVLGSIRGKRILVVGGTDSIGQSLSELGLIVKQYGVTTNLGTKDLGSYDCIVFMIKYVSHSSVYLAKSEAVKYGKPAVYFYGTNIDNICRRIYGKLNHN